MTFRQLWRELKAVKHEWRGWHRVLFYLSIALLFVLMVVEKLLCFLLGQRTGASELATCEAAIQRNPRDGEALFGRGRIRMDMGEYAGALDDLDKAIRYGFQPLEAYRSRAHC